MRRLSNSFRKDGLSRTGTAEAVFPFVPWKERRRTQLLVTNCARFHFLDDGIRQTHTNKGRIVPPEQKICKALVRRFWRKYCHCEQLAWNFLYQLVIMFTLFARIYVHVVSSVINMKH